MIKAKFTNKTKELIYDRDGQCCIFCGSNTTLQFHHIFFGMQSIYAIDRNISDMGVCVCFTHHLEIHSCAKGEGKRQGCINYIKNKLG